MMTTTRALGGIDPDYLEQLHLKGREFLEKQTRNGIQRLW